MVRSFGSVARQSWCLPALLVAISAVGSWKFACITPFAGSAVAAAYALSMRAAFLTITAIWLANQAIGFAVLGYPWTVDTLLWGIAIGAAALLAAACAGVTLRLAIRNTIVAVGLSLLAALCAYEGGLFLMTFALGGRDAFTPAIVAHVALLNLGWTVALIGTYEILRHGGTVSGDRAGSLRLSLLRNIFPL